MRSFKTYIPNLILSVLLVFSFIGTLGLLAAKEIASPSKLKTMTANNEISAKIRTELGKYFEDRYNVTGIPADSYTSALTDEYIQQTVDMYIDCGFNYINGSDAPDFKIPENKKLVENLSNVFNNYADSIAYEKDDLFYIKLNETIESAYNAVGEYSDVYKMSAMYNSKTLDKIRKIYPHLNSMVFGTSIACVVLMIILLALNRKNKSDTLYWIGISAALAGIIGAVPSIYLIKSNYFDSFTIKQPQIFTSFTSAMYKAVQIFMNFELIILAVGIILAILYLFFHGRKTAK